MPASRRALRPPISLLTLILALGFAGTGNAAVILQAVEFNGAPIAPTSSIQYSTGDTFLLEVRFVGEVLPSGTQNAEQIDIVWDTNGFNTLNAGPIQNGAQSRA